VFGSQSLGERVGVRLNLKCESFQKTGSFKPRGALNVVLSIAPERRRRGLITVSAGNHAQAVAWAARAVGVSCTVVMPADAPRSKVDAVHGYGATIVAHDDRATLFDRLREEEAKTGAAFVHPFDDPAGLAGAGTVGLEIEEDAAGADAVIVPVGGGGLVAGITAALRDRIRIVAVEPEGSQALHEGLRHGRPTPVDPRSIADGLSAPFAGGIALQVCRDVELATVTEQEIEDAFRFLYQRAKLACEPAGAVAAAAWLAGKVEARAPVCVVSGGNVDGKTASAILAAR
jgi:threonine dehydratase